MPQTLPAEPNPDCAVKDSLTDTAYQKIKAAILHCELPPGSRFSEQQIASLLQVSRTPVHQAVVKLEQEGWLRFLPRKGVQISSVTADEMRHVYEVLMSLEALGVMRLASREAHAADGIDQALDQARREGERAWSATTWMPGPRRTTASTPCSSTAAAIRISPVWRATSANRPTGRACSPCACVPRRWRRTSITRRSSMPSWRAIRWPRGKRWKPTGPGEWPPCCRCWSSSPATAY